MQKSGFTGVNHKKGLAFWAAFLVFSYLGHAQMAFDLPHTQTVIKIDGRAEEWSLTQSLPIMRGIEQEMKVKYGWQWDHDYLYLAADVEDHFLAINELGNDNPKLYFNDALEVYLDAKADSKSSMDLNDYQFLVDIKGQKTVFKGNKWMMQDGARVPKDYEGTNIVFYAATVLRGTCNDSTDLDEGYFMEIAIPWSAVGIVPTEGTKLKMDLCFDDVDTLSNIRKWPVDFHPAVLQYTSITGKNDFGFPQHWPTFTLVGTPGWWYQVQNALARLPVLFLVLMAMLLAVMIYAIITQYQKIQYLKSLPSRAEFNLLNPVHGDQQSMDQSQNDHLPMSKTEEGEVAFKIKQYVENHLSDDIAIADLAAFVNKSVRQLQRMCKAETGLSPLQFITILKLEKAGQHIVNSQETIAEIAYRYGFSDPSYFGSVFKKYFGKTPLEYRNSEA
ncbi:MAG TPA: helix-turn-helix domain-containing protein [Saprospiraceae bacterium]|nr:helix-turn-helix domain-containing protein [Saprospiraceae bacterium]